MATLEQIGAALKAADAAGNVEDAKRLAAAYKAASSVAPVDIEAAKGIVLKEQIRQVPIVGPVAGLAMDIGAGMFDGKKEGLRVPNFIVQAEKAIRLPHEVLTQQNANFNPGDLPSDEAIGEAANLGGMLTGLGGAVPAGKALALSQKGVGPVSKAAADEFGIPLTKGQASGKLRALSKEERLRQVDGPGQTIMRDFDKQQGDAITKAADDIGAKVGTGADDMAGGVITGIKDKVAFSKDRASSLYDIGEAGGLTVKSKAVADLPLSIDRNLAERSVTVDPIVTPVADFAIKEIQKRAAAKGFDGALGDVASVRLTEIEGIRKMLVQLKGNTDEDRRAVYNIKRSFDEWLDDAVDTMLVTGDESALQAYKAARAETTVYKKLTTERDADPASGPIVKMQREDATAEEVANWLYGSDIANPTKVAPKVAKRVKETLGETSPEWSAVKAAAWQRLVKDLKTGDVHSATMIAKRIEQFINEKGPTLSKVLFTKEQRDQMLAFAEVLKKTVTPRDATNPSRSGWTIAGALGGTIMRSIAGVVGYKLGGPELAVASMLAVPVFKNVGARMAASKAVKGVGDGALKPIPGARKALPTMNRINNINMFGGETKSGSALSENWT